MKHILLILFLLLTLLSHAQAAQLTENQALAIITEAAQMELHHGAFEIERPIWVSSEAFESMNDAMAVMAVDLRFNYLDGGEKKPMTCKADIMFMTLAPDVWTIHSVKFKSCDEKEETQYEKI